ncbi:MAG: hypothetical protein M3362_01285 [Acidobacteriota bacterium]|nr:hypothetical protein [Acidobacteriota bacterium]
MWIYPYPAQAKNAFGKKNRQYSSEALQTHPSQYKGRRYTAEEVKQLIISYSQQYRLNPTLPLCIVFHESGYQWSSVNKAGSSARGAAQHLLGTWLNRPEGKAGRSRFDADASIRAMITHMAYHKDATPWVARNHCKKLNYDKLKF